MQHQYSTTRANLALLFCSILGTTTTSSWGNSHKSNNDKAPQVKPVVVDEASYFPLPGKSKTSRRVVFILYINDPGVNRPQYISPAWFRAVKRPVSVKLTLLTSGKHLPVKIDIIKNRGFDRAALKPYIECHGVIRSQQALPQKTTIIGFMTFIDKKNRYTLQFRIPVTASQWVPQDPT